MGVLDVGMHYRGKHDVDVHDVEVVMHVMACMTRASMMWTCMT